MSDTAEIQSATATEPTPIPNFSVKQAASLMRGGREFQLWRVTFGARNAEFRKLGLGDSWDLMEMSPGETSDRWFGMASIAAAVTAIDGELVPPPMGDTISRAQIRRVLDKLGMDGLMAVGAALRQIDPPTPTDTAATAKN